MNKEVKKWLRELRRAGYNTRTNGRNHTVISRNGKLLATVPGNPCLGGIRKSKCDLRRAESGS